VIISLVISLRTRDSPVCVKSMLPGTSFKRQLIAHVSLKVRIFRTVPSGLTTSEVLHYGANKGCTGDVVTVT